ncbi:C39 family peptidase [Candidatus Peregrinibacteria bacterium]|nr:C39 family peptidase [Candidatus Peregrinibacteria bacterium]
MKRPFVAFFPALLLLGLAGAFLFHFRVTLKDSAASLLKLKLPAEKTRQEVVVDKTAAAEPPLSANLQIPFVPQAPFGDWSLPYKEACEEASLIMAHYYFIGKTLSPAIMDEEIRKLVEWEKNAFGYHKDTNAEEMARMLREYFGHKDVEVRGKFSIEDVKRAVAEGYPVILPVAGRLLGNLYFRQPGPLYHALVVKGYMKNGKIITNDPGTKRGKDFVYSAETLMKAIHDWNPKNILKGLPKIVIVKP